MYNADVFAWFKKYFIPHEENDDQPHILRSKSVLFLAIILAGAEIMFLLGAFFILPDSRFFGLIMPGAIVDETNTSRELYNLTSLKRNSLLDAAAMEKVKDMAEKGYFAHTSPDGVAPWYWFADVGYKFSYAGENLAVNFIDSSDVVNAWMSSPSHRENVLSVNFTEIGVAAAKGIYKGREANFVVQFFGRPAKSYAAEAPLPGIKQTSAAGYPAQLSIIKDETVAGTSGSAGFVAVKGDEVAADSSSVSRPGTIAGVSDKTGSIESITASPRKTLNYLFYAAGLLTIIALALNIFVKIEVQHARLIMNGLLILLLVVGILLINQYVSLSQIKIL
ncbi:MAG: CAP domain-containing protein [Patescibacteria group bacterium]